MKTPEKITELFSKRIERLYKTKSQSSINQVNELHQSLVSLEKTRDQHVADKFLVGFLEDKGFRSYEEFINSLT